MRNCYPIIRTLAVTLGAIACSAAPAAAAAKPQQIIGGTSAPANTWPSIAHVSVDLNNGFITNCGGTVVSPEWVVTAAHCAIDLNRAGQPTYAPAQFSVITGRHDLRTNAGQELRVSQVVVHPAYDRNGPSFGSDVALLRLSSPTAAPAMAVATRAALDAGAYVMLDGVPNVAGWGLTNGNDNESDPPDLHEVFAPLRTNADCAALDLPSTPAFDPATMLCAGVPGKSSCHGDSGGPLVVFTRDRTPVLYGVVSWGEPKCDRPVSFYARITAFTDFLAPALPPAPEPPAAPPVLTPVPTPVAAAPAPVTAPAPPADLVAPRLSRIEIPAIIRRSGRRARRNVVIRVRSSEPATAIVTLLRRTSSRSYRKVKGTYRATLVAGANRIVLPRNAWRLRNGAYRIELRATDTTGNTAGWRANVRVRR